MFTSSIARADSISLGGGAVLSYTHMYNTSTCWSGMTVYYQYETWDNFSFRDQYGSSQSIPAGAVYYHTENCQQGPPPGPNPPVGYITLSGTDSHGSKFVITFNFVANSASIRYPAPPISGWINPKFVILTVTYAPPGHSSNVNYTNTTMLGTSTSVFGSFSDQIGHSITLTSSGIFNTQSSTQSTSFAQYADTSSSVSLSKTTAWQNLVRGPDNSAEGVNHDYDVVWLWLNPILKFTIDPENPNSIQWNGYSYDQTDMPVMDIYGVYLGYLTGKWQMGPDVYDPLARAWASGQDWPEGEGPALTAEDLAKIAGADPFSDPAYHFDVPVGQLTSSDKRFTATTNQNASFVPPPPGGQPYTQSYSVNYTLTQTEGKTAKYTYTQAYSTEDEFTLQPFGIGFKLKLKDERTLTWVNQWSTTRTNVSGQTAAFSITGPTFDDYYIGPTQFLVFQDNIYGTFMFFPNGPTLASIAVNPASTTLVRGSSQQFSATGTYSDDSTEDLTNFLRWTSSDTSVATVSSTGLVTAVGSGSAIIFAESGSISGFSEVTVNDATLLSIAVTPVNPTISRGSTLQFTATGTYSDNSTRNLTNSVTWTSSNTAIATIASGGLATGASGGTTTIQATSGTVSGTTGLTVTAPPAISSLSPTSGPVNTIVSITGTSFGATRGTSTVTFNGTSVITYVSWSNTLVRVRVPPGATTGYVVVTVGGAPSNGRLFTVN